MNTGFCLMLEFDTHTLCIGTAWIILRAGSYSRLGDYISNNCVCIQIDTHTQCVLHRQAT